MPRSPASPGSVELTGWPPQLLKTLGLRVSCIKIDPYVSVDAGLMAPAEHGECFVLCSGPYIPPEDTVDIVDIVA
jgi:hypothetical protein